MSKGKTNFKDYLQPAHAKTGVRIGVNVSPDTADKFYELAEKLNVSNKALFVALVEAAYNDVA